MPDLSVLTGSAAALLVIVILLWFAIGTQWNIRRGNELLRWLEGGLPLFGRQTTLRWLGSSAVELKIDRPKPPFEEAEVVIVLEPRDVPWFWVLGRARGRRDFLILRGRPRRKPGYELEAFAPDGWTARESRRNVDPSWREEDWDSAVHVVHSLDADVRQMRQMWAALEAVSGGLWRLSVRRDPPGLQVHALLPDTAVVSSEALVRAFCALASNVR